MVDWLSCVHTVKLPFERIISILFDRVRRCLVSLLISKMKKRFDSRESRERKRERAVPEMDTR